jgi:single-strand selective monofunctional uracil DNA glycosylase
MPQAKRSKSSAIKHVSMSASSSALQHDSLRAPMQSNAPTDELIAISRALSRALKPLRFAAPVAHTYAPLLYAREPHERYLALAHRNIDALFVGMNPGPFGMVQTGVPFGEVAAVREFLQLDGRVRMPADMHPKRVVSGFACTRSEVSGQRFWGLFSRAFSSRDECFKRMFVWNYCPLAFVSASGANITPDKLARDEREAIQAPCHEALWKIVDVLRPRMVIGVGAFAHAVALQALTQRPLSNRVAPLEFAQILHPSPASPAANRGWEPIVRAELTRLSVLAK